MITFRKLYADPASLILGILSIMILVFGCCCGLLAIPALILSIVGLVLANKSLREYNNSPEEYNPKSKNNVAIGRTVSLIGLILSSAYLLIVCGYFVIYGAMISDTFKDSLEEMRNVKKEIDLEIEKDSITRDWKANDTTYTDSTIIIEEIKKTN